MPIPVDRADRPMFSLDGDKLSIRERELAAELAETFHAVYERLAPEHGYKTKDETKCFDPESPNGKLMVAVCREVAVTRIIQLEKEVIGLVGALEEAIHWNWQVPESIPAGIINKVTKMVEGGDERR